MRIKWNRHLDGSSSRRPEDEPATQETDEKKRGSSSSTNIFRIFRRKKNRRRGEDDDKTTGNNGTAPASHPDADEDDCASVTSIATCASQPVSDGFQRDRASSLFSSFRLSLPGSKRKKRRIAPTPSETLLNGQQSEPQTERYSTPDLRKPSDKLELPPSAQVSLSTSSPSIRNPRGASISAQSLEDQNSESLDKLKWMNARSTPSSNSKLSKSVSFSDCKDDLIDSSHSTSDNKPPRALNSTAMVEEDSGALESELPACMSDNLCMSRESKLKSVDDSSSFEANASTLHKHPSDGGVNAVEMTKTESGGNNSSNAIQDSNKILYEIVSEIDNYQQADNGVRTKCVSLQNTLATSLINCDSSGCHNDHNDKVIKDVKEEERNNGKYAACVNMKTTAVVQRVETGSVVSSVPERNKFSESDNRDSDTLLLPNEGKDNSSLQQVKLDIPTSTELPFNEILLASSLTKLANVTPPNSLSKVNSCETIQNNEHEIDSAVCDINKSSYEISKCDSQVSNTQSDYTVKEPISENSKHVMCHMRIFEDKNKVLPQKVSDFCVIENSLLVHQNPLTENTSETQSVEANFLLKNNSITFPSKDERKTESGDLNSSLITAVSKFSTDIKLENCNSRLKYDLTDNRAPSADTCIHNKIEHDDEVPVEMGSLRKDSCLQNDVEAPEFELSLLEFEEVCNKYMSNNRLQFSEYNSIIPHYSDSPKRKSVLDTNFCFIYPHFSENGNSENCEENIGNSEDPVLSGQSYIKQNNEVCKDLSHQDSCQSVTEEHSLPSPPKQWINYGKPIENEFSRDVCTDRVQCTKIRGKNLCQEPCLEGLPTTVMHGDSDLGGIDTPQLSSTLQAFENKSGRECSSIVAAEKQQPSDDRTPPKDMISNVGITIPTLNRVLDYSYISETPSKSSIYFDSEIRDSYRNQRAICDPLIYSKEVTKGIGTLEADNYLSGHNFCDIRSVGLGEIINDVSCDYVQSGNGGLIEISNPYQEDPFTITHEISSRSFLNGTTVSISSDDTNNSNNNDILDSTCAPRYSSHVDISLKNDAERGKTRASKEKEDICKSKGNEKFSEDDKAPPRCDRQQTRNIVSEIKPKNPILNEDRPKEKRLSSIEQKNLINKSKNSMIPCRIKGLSDSEPKRTETKLKSKKANTIPRFSKNESTLPSKNDSSLRVLSNSFKDSDVGQLRSKLKDSAPVRYNGNHSVSPVLSFNSESVEGGNKVSDLNPSLDIVNRQDITCFEGKNEMVNECSNMLETSDMSDVVSNLDEKSYSSSVSLDLHSSVNVRDEPKNTKSILPSACIISDTSVNNSENLDVETDVSPLDAVTNFDINNSNSSVPENSLNGTRLTTGYLSECSLLNNEEHIGMSVEYKSANLQNGLKHLDSGLSVRRSSLPAVTMCKKSFTSSKESLNSQLTSSSKSNVGKSRIPRKQPGTRGAQPSGKGPVRPPMWLSKAELSQEIQRLGTLCEARTKELNRLKMETKHVSSGFDAFAALFKYMVEDLNGLSVPTLTEDLGKTLKQLELTKQDLAYYEREVEEMKSHHCQELNDLSNKLFEVYQSEVAELNAKHREEVSHLNSDHQKQIEHLTTTFDSSSSEAKAHHEKLIAKLEQELINQREELQMFHEREIKDLEEKHTESTKLLQEHIEQLQKKCAELKQHSMSMEDAMRKDTDSKLQWVAAAKLDLEKEVESLKAVLEMKNKELHLLRVQNLEMEKQLEELPFAREKIKMLQARAEDLEALMAEKTKLERKLSTENQQIRDTYEKESKVNRRLSMENEELQWRLRQAENSLISGSFSEVPEFPEEAENAATSPTKSPGPQLLSRSVFFTFVDKDESTLHSPRSQYKKIMPGFSANYKTSPAKSSKSPPAPSPRRGKSHSEPPQPLTVSSTPRKNAKQSLSKTKGPQKRPRSGSDSNRPVSEHSEVNFSSVTDSMNSSVSSESSVFEHRERLLEEHKEQIIHSLEILREQRSTESSTDEPSMMEKKWYSDDIKITGELSNLETEDMSRSAEFADPKTYYHMTFPVLKESGITDCDIEDGCRNSSSNNSPMKEAVTKHSMSENNIKSSVDAELHTTQNMSVLSYEVSSTSIKVDNKRNSCTELTISAENVQRGAAESSVAEKRWRTI